MFGWSRFRCEQKVVSLLWLAHMSIYSQVSLREPSWRVVVSRTFIWGDIGIQQINEGRTRTCEITGPSWSSRSNHPTEKGWTFTQQIFSNFYRDGKVTRLQLPDVCGWLYCVPHEDLETKSKHVLWDRTDKHRFPHEMNWNEPWVKSRALQILEKSICHPYKPSNHWNGGWPLLVGLQNVNKIHHQKSLWWTIPSPSKSTSGRGTISTQGMKSESFTTSMFFSNKILQWSELANMIEKCQLFFCHERDKQLKKHEKNSWFCVCSQTKPLSLGTLTSAAGGSTVFLAPARWKPFILDQSCINGSSVLS